MDAFAELRDSTLSILVTDLDANPAAGACGAVLLNRDSAAARSFLAFLRSGAGRSIIEASGYRVP